MPGSYEDIAGEKRLIEEADYLDTSVNQNSGVIAIFLGIAFLAGLITGIFLNQYRISTNISHNCAEHVAPELCKIVTIRHIRDNRHE